MKYKLVPRKNPQKKDDPPKVYAQPTALLTPISSVAK